MKRFFLKFLMYFLFLFIINLIVNAIFKTDIDVLTAFSVAFGFSAGLTFFQYYSDRKTKKDVKH